MIEVFSQNEKLKARKQKNIMLTVWLIALVAVVAVIVTFVCVGNHLVGTFRNRDHTVWMGIVSVLLLVLFGCGSLFFFSIKFRLTSKYVKMLRDIDRGLKDEISAKFVGWDETITMKDGVYFYSMVLDAKPLKREDITERKVLIEQTMPKIDITPGSKLKIISHANILVAYDVLERAPEPIAEEQGQIKEQEQGDKE